MLILLVIVAVVLLLAIGMYNSLVRLKVQCDNAWADIDVQLKRRHDLIPNVVETVKGYAGHEKGTLEAVINARNRAMTAQGPAAKGEAEGMLAGSVATMPQLIRIASGLAGSSLRAALAMASLTPARALGLPLGRIAPGTAADLVVMTRDLQVRATLVAGRIVFKA